ncbi:(E,E)-alpha-farnesene synthase [Quercus suber]|uniref:(E,E)-alpha-farnesene synthase n=1 Tax=Quercus suber TaxID=58331 RepID=A0AAW0KVQ3_QUESU
MHIQGMINKTWKKINGQCLNQYPTQQFVNIATNTVRMAHSLYQNGDGFGQYSKSINLEAHLEFDYNILEWRVQWFDIKWYIDAYEKDTIMNAILRTMPWIIL